MEPIKLWMSGEDYPQDVTRIQTAIMNHRYACTREQAQDLWLAYSGSMAAGWLILDSYSEDSIWAVLQPFMDLQGLR